MHWRHRPVERGNRVQNALVVRANLRSALPLVMTVCLGSIGCASTAGPPRFESYDAFKRQLLSIVEHPDEGKRLRRLDGFWEHLRAAGAVPYVQGNRYAFLYRGPEDQVAWSGDFSGWKPRPGRRLAGTDLWILEGELPADARVDYKLVLNGQRWILDPANRLQVWGTFGPNSELRMPEYVDSPHAVRRDNVPRGQVSPDTALASEHLGYRVNYRVYTPAGYAADSLQDLPVVYVTDGHEYLAESLGRMAVVLDNLIADGLLRPVIAVFIDARDPDHPRRNRRMQEYAVNPKYADFVADELVPAVDRDYRTRATAGGRIILGTSLGGLNAAYLGAVKGETFGKVAAQSPAFKFRPEIYDRYETGPLHITHMVITNGTIHDALGAKQMADIVAARGLNFRFIETHQGHSWINWRAVLDEVLIELVGPPGPSASVAADGDTAR